MKKKVPMFLGCLVISASLLVGSINVKGEEQAIRMQVNGSYISTDVAPVVFDGRTLVPLNVIATVSGAETKWDGATKSITVLYKGKMLLLDINSPVMKILEEDKMTEVLLDVPPKLINGRSMVPMRTIAENLDLWVGWEPNTKTVFVDSYKNEKIAIHDKTLRYAIQAELNRIDELNRSTQESYFMNDLYRVKQLKIKDGDCWEITKLPNVHQLILEGKIENVSTIYGLNKLTDLTVIGDSIANAIDYNRFEKIESLSFQGNSFLKYQELAHQTTLKAFSVTSENTPDWLWKVNIPNLEKLSLHIDNLSLEYMDAYPKLKEVHVKSKKIDNMKILQKCGELVKLSVEYVDEKKDDALFKTLEKHKNDYFDIDSVLQYNSMLQTIELRNVPAMQDYTYIRNKSKLKTLRIEAHELKNVETLKDAMLVEKIILKSEIKSRISDIHFIEYMKKLTYIEFESLDMDEADKTWLNNFKQLNTLKVDGKTIKGTAD